MDAKAEATKAAAARPVISPLQEKKDAPQAFPHLVDPKPSPKGPDRDQDESDNDVEEAKTVLAAELRTPPGVAEAKDGGGGSGGGRQGLGVKRPGGEKWDTGKAQVGLGKGARRMLLVEGRRGFAVRRNWRLRPSWRGY